MKILMVLTYYRPHISGLTLYVQRLAEGLAARGHDVTVLASQHQQHLPGEERIHGVQVVRVPVAFRVSKGPVMPTFASEVWKQARQHDVVSIHLPQFDAGIATIVSRVAGRHVFLTYHCDLNLPAGPFNRLVDAVVFSMNFVAGLFANRIVAYTRDYAEYSNLLTKFRDKITVIPPPVPVPPVPGGARDSLRKRLHLEDKCVIGSATRIATEKGIEYLLRAIPFMEDDLPNVHVLHVGENKNVIGEEAYLRSLDPLLERFEDRVTLMGTLPPDEMGAFFSSIDVLVVSSINSTESFGLVQVESMLCGTPVVATNLPGVRAPVEMTGMGEVVAVGDSRGLADGVMKVVRDPSRYQRPRGEIAAMFDIERTLTEYEELFESSSDASTTAVAG